MRPWPGSRRMVPGEGHEPAQHKHRAHQPDADDHPQGAGASWSIANSHQRRSAYSRCWWANWARTATVTSASSVAIAHPASNDSLAIGVRRSKAWRAATRARANRRRSPATPTSPERSSAAGMPRATRPRVRRQAPWIRRASPHESNSSPVPTMLPRKCEPSITTRGRRRPSKASRPGSLGRAPKSRSQRPLRKVSTASRWGTRAWAISASGDGATPSARRAVPRQISAVPAATSGTR